jgi:hypothetical protein
MFFLLAPTRLPCHSTGQKEVTVTSFLSDDEPIKFSKWRVLRKWIKESRLHQICVCVRRLWQDVSGFAILFLEAKAAI